MGSGIPQEERAELCGLAEPIPLLVRFPGAEHGGTRADLCVQHHDIFATVLEAAAGGVDNFRVLSGHKTMPLALEALLEAPEVALDSTQGDAPLVSPRTADKSGDSRKVRF